MTALANPPEFKVLSSNLPEFPLEVLPTPARGYCEFLAEGGLPLEYLGPVALTLMAGAIGGLVKLQIGDGYWEEPNQLWTLTVGMTGSGKSPAVKNLRRAIDEIEGPWRRSYQEKLEEWKLLPLKERKNHTPPACKRMVIADATYEKTIRLLAEEQNQAGLVLIADEFASFVRGLGQYKQANSSDRANFLTVWTSQPLSFDRVTDGVSLFVPHPVINILGGTQPHLLGALTGDDGFRDRFLISIYDKPIQAHEWVTPNGQQDRWKGFIQHLASIRDRSRSRLLTEDAKGSWLHFCNQFRNIQNDPNTPGHLVGWTAKAPSHLARLALLLCEADGHGEVNSGYLKKAYKLVSYFGAHYRQLPLNEPDPMLPSHRQGEDRAVQAIEAYLRRRSDHKATRRELQRAQVGGIRTGKELDTAIERYCDTHGLNHKQEERVSGGQQVVLYAPGLAPFSREEYE